MITVVDNAIPENLYKPFSDHIHSQPMYYVWKNPEGIDEPRGHLTIPLSKSGFDSSLENEHHLKPPVREVWDFIKPNLKNKDLITCYVNGHTYGLDGYYHVDASTKYHDMEKYDYTTFILYINEEWIPEWGGETVFLDNSEIVKTVLPKRNRAAIFSSTIVHAPRQCTRIFKGLRLTVVFRTRGKRQ